MSTPPPNRGYTACSSLPNEVVLMDTDSETPLLETIAQESELEAKLNRRATWLLLMAFVALAELLVVVEVIRRAL